MLASLAKFTPRFARREIGKFEELISNFARAQARANFLISTVFLTDFNQVSSTFS